MWDVVLYVHIGQILLLRTSISYRIWTKIDWVIMDTWEGLYVKTCLEICVYEVCTHAAVQIADVHIWYWRRICLTVVSNVIHFCIPLMNYYRTSTLIGDHTHINCTRIRPLWTCMYRQWFVARSLGLIYGILSKISYIYFDKRVLNLY